MFGPEASLSNEDMVALFRARYNEDYLKYQADYVDETYRNQKPFQMNVAPLIERSFNGRISKYNEQTSSLVHSILMEQIRTRLINKLQSNLYRDSRLRRILGHTSGAAAEIKIEVEVAGYPRIDVKIYGPFWLRFFYYGRRAFTIKGNPSNHRAHGMLVFYDPETGDKMVVPEVHMKAIPPGLYVERAVEFLKSELDTNPRFLDEYLGDTSEREFIQENMRKQLNRIRDQQGLQITALLQDFEAGNLTRSKVEETRRRLEIQERNALANLRNIVAGYEAKGMPESRETKAEVYAALREYLNNVKTHLITSSQVLTELPVNLAGRSTARRIIAQYK